MSINILNEQINKRVVYEDDNYELYLPYNIASICSMVPQWCKDKEIKKRVVDAFKQSYVTYILTGKKDINNTSVILMDNSSKIPLILSGNYHMFNPITQTSIWPQITNVKKYFSNKPGLIDKLKLQYTLKERLKYEMPFSEKEMVGFSQKNDFAKTIYDQIQGKHIPFDTWEAFEGRDDVDVIDAEWYAQSMANGALAILPDNQGVMIFAENEYYKEKFLDLHEDDDWVYSAAMHDYYDDCEELDTEEMNYISSYLNAESRAKLQELRQMVDLPRFTEAELEHEEGLVMDFLEEYFPIQADRFSGDWLYSLGCALTRGRKAAMKKEIEDELTFDFDDHGKVTEMFLSWPQLLQIVGKNDINTWEGLEEIELNGLPSLYDSWWDSWEVDNEGMEELNGDFARLVEEINEVGWEKIKELQQKRESYMKKIEELGFKEHRGWISGIGNPYKLGVPEEKGSELAVYYVGNYDPEKDTVKFRDESGHDTPQTKEMELETFINYVTNPRIPFPKEEKEVNENYTSKIINIIISNIIQENVHK